MRISKTFYRVLVSLCFVGLSFQVKAQTSFEFMPAGQLNLMIDGEQSFYLNIGGPTLYLFDSPNSKSGIVFTPSLKFKNLLPKFARGSKTSQKPKRLASCIIMGITLHTSFAMVTFVRLAKQN